MTYIWILDIHAPGLSMDQKYLKEGSVGDSTVDNNLVVKWITCLKLDTVMKTLVVASVLWLVLSAGKQPMSSSSLVMTSN